MQDVFSPGFVTLDGFNENLRPMNGTKVITDGTAALLVKWDQKLVLSVYGTFSVCQKTSNRDSTTQE